MRPPSECARFLPDIFSTSLCYDLSFTQVSVIFGDLKMREKYFPQWHKYSNDEQIVTCSLRAIKYYTNVGINIFALERNLPFQQILSIETFLKHCDIVISTVFNVGMFSHFNLSLT